MANKKINSNGHDYVDLGLPSGTLWATCNVGANEPADYGLYFQWGDTEGHTANEVGIEKWQKKFADDWSDYKWRSNEDKKKFAKYGNKGVSLRLQDDAARANMGGSWHIPTPTQIKELLDNTTSYWLKMNDVNGMKFISKKDSSKYIFIPATGYAQNGKIHRSNDNVFLQTSKLSPGSIYCCGYAAFKFGFRYFGGSYRSNGLQVRAVIG